MRTNNGAQNAGGHAVTCRHQANSNRPSTMQELAEFYNVRILSSPLEEVLHGPLDTRKPNLISAAKLERICKSEQASARTRLFGCHCRRYF